MRHRPGTLTARILLLALVIAGTVVGSVPSPGPRGPRVYKPHVPGTVLLKFRPGTRPSERASIRAQLQATKKHRFRSGAEAWTLGAGISTEKAITRFENHPRVQYIEPDYIYEADLTPDDPSYPFQWHLNNVGQTGGTPGADIGAEAAWDLTTGSHSVLVGVIDSGIDYTHPDLAANIWTNPGEIPGNGIDDDLNGFIDDVRGWDFVNADNDPFDDNGHGTHVAGILGAAGNNATGVTGVAWDVSMIPLKFLNASGTGPTSAAVQALDYAVLVGARVTNNSWGGGSFSQTLLDAIVSAEAAGQLFVASAGNSNNDNDVTPHYPSSYDVANVISVASTDHNDNKASNSSYGATTVDLGAPGVNIFSTFPSNNYGQLSGTSMAAPQVTGVAALTLANAPTLDVATLKRAILDFAEPVPGLAGITLTGARLHAPPSVAGPDPNAPDPVTGLAAEDPTSNTVTLRWIATGDDGAVGTATRYDIRYSTSPIDETTFDSGTPAAGIPPPAPAGTPEMLEVGGLAPDTTYYFAVRAIDEWSNRSALGDVVSATTLPPPAVATAPPDFTFSLLTGQTGAQTLTIENVAGGTLDWRIPLPTVGTAPAAAPSPAVLIEKDETDTRAGLESTVSPGEPDRSGYRYEESTVAGGPVFEWHDITGSGTVLAELDGDDQISAPVDLGFDFPFYGSYFGGVRVSTNGFIALGAGEAAPIHQLLPCSAESRGLIAPFWTDLDFDGSPRAAYLREWDRFTLQYTGVGRRGSGGSFTFQVVLHETGEIRFNYLTMSGDTATASVGIQSPDATAGLPLAFNSDFVQEGQAVALAATPQWLTVSPDSGRLFAGETIGVAVTADARMLPGGAYAGEVIVESNDPGNPSVTHPVSLDVTDSPAIDVSPDQIDFGDIFVGFRAVEPVVVTNTGTLGLTVSGITPDDPAFTADPASFGLAPGDSRTVSISFTPPADGAFAGKMTITSDASNTPAFAVDLAGNGLPAPGVSVSPLSLTRTLMTGETAGQVLSVTNHGGSDLNLLLTPELVLDGTQNVSTWAPAPKGDESLNGSGALPPASPPPFRPSRFSVRTSDEAAGPDYAWTDISGTGTPVPIKSDDETSDPIPLGFDFPYYGEIFDSVRVSTNGWLSFTSSLTSFSNPDTLPNLGDSVPENLVAPFFDDLDFGGTLKAFHASEAGVFTVQYADVARSEPGSSLTFQVQLREDGRIRFLYESVSGVLDSATIGLQSGDRSEGEVIAHNQDFLHDQLLIEAIPVPTIINGSFESGDFTGWNAFDNGFDGLTPWTVSPGGGGYFGLTAPVDGLQSAYNGFDGEAGLRYTLAQEIDIPTGLSDAELSYYDRIQYDSMGLTSFQPRVYDAQIRDTAGNFLARIAREEIRVSGQPYTDLGWRRRSVDLIPFSGLTIRLELTQFIPESFTGPATIEFDDFRITSSGIPDWLDVDPVAATLAPGETRDFQVSFDAGLSGSTVLQGAVRLDTNVPGAPVLRVPATLTVIGSPDIGLQGEEIRLSSTQEYSGQGASTSHSLPITIPPAHGGTLELIAEGDYGANMETVSLTAEGRLVGTAGGTGTDCLPVFESFTISPSLMADLAADGVVEIEAQNSTDVHDFCPSNRHMITLVYRLDDPDLVFKPLFVGASATRNFVVQNSGSDPLVVTGITGGGAEFTTDPTAFSVEPGGSQVVNVTFSPSAVGPVSTTLLVASNDPDTPSAALSVSGEGLEPPVLRVAPTSISSTLLSGTSEIRILEIANDGGSPMDFALSGRSLPSSNGVPGSQAACSPTKVYFTEFSNGRLSEMDLATLTVTTITGGLDSPNQGLVIDSNLGVAYVAEAAAGSIASVDLGSGLVTRIASSLAFPLGLALDSAGETLYYTEFNAGTLSSLDLDTGTRAQIANGLGSPAGIALKGSGDGFYVAEFNGQAVSEVDLATGTATRIATGLGSPYSVTIDTIGSRLLVTEFNAGELSEIELGTGQVRTIAGSLSGPVGLATDLDASTAYIAEFTTSRILRVDLATGTVAAIQGNINGPTGLTLGLPAGCVSTFMSLSPLAGTVPPFGSVPVQVTLDAGGLLAGGYNAEIDVSTDAPATPLQIVPVTLDVTGVPDISLEGTEIHVESKVDFASDGALTDHSLPIDVLPQAGGTLELIADGDFGSAFETATADAEGVVSIMTSAAFNDCVPTLADAKLTPAEMSTLVADGVVEVSVQNSFEVNAFCPVNAHTVRLSYELSPDSLDYRQVFVNASRDLFFDLANRGSDNLTVHSITSNDAAFTVPGGSLMIPPRTRRTVAVTFVPPAVGSFSAEVRISSDDPDTPLITIPATGQGVEPPVVRADPPSVAATLLAGDLEEQTVTLFNDGGSDLRFRAEPRIVGGNAVRSEFEGLTPGIPGASNNPEPAGAPEGEPATAGAPATPHEVDEAPGPRVLGAPGDFELLANSPDPLTCITADPSTGILYGQSDPTLAFYRYVAATDQWERLADAPILSTNNCGAAFLKGKVYTAYVLDAVLGVYDVATDTWNTIPNPLGKGTGNIASDGNRYIYLVEGTDLVRLDPATGDTATLSSPPFPFERWGGLRHLNGLLYGHQGNGLVSFAAYDITGDRWHQLGPLPAGAVLGAAIDPKAGEYYAYGSYGGRNLMRYDIQDASWTVFTIPFFVVNDGGMAWLKGPEAGIYFAQGQGGIRFGRFLTGTPFLSILPDSGVLPPGGSMDLSLTFESDGLQAGIFDSEVSIESNDPVTPVLSIPARLTVMGAPKLTIAGKEIVVESFKTFTSAGETTTHSVALPVPPAGQARVELLAQGDYGAAGETATVFAEGELLGSVGGVGVDCTTAFGVFGIPATILSALTADGVIDFEVVNSAAVSPFCGDNDHRVRLRYNATADKLDFGEIFVGYPASIDITALNSGTDLLEVFSAIADRPEYKISPSSFNVPPGASQVVTITFDPLTDGSFPGLLTLQSNDPRAAVTEIQLAGTAIHPPVIQISPSPLMGEAIQGTTTTETLTVANAGGSDLTFHIDIFTGGLPDFISLSQSSGTVQAGGSVDVGVTLDTLTFDPRLRVALLEITSNDPAAIVTPVSVQFRVRGTPDLKLVGVGETLMESSIDFGTPGAVTRHKMGPADPPTGDITIEVDLEGNFGGFLHTATSRTEGIFLGVAGGAAGTPCTTVTRSFVKDINVASFLLSDGFVNVDVSNSPLVLANCSVNRHTVRVSYPSGTGNLLDFGSLFVGASNNLQLEFDNLGNDTLEVPSITTDTADYSSSHASVLLGVGGRAAIQITFAPQEAGVRPGILTLLTNDPDTPVLEIELTGVGVPPPVAQVQPRSFEVALPPVGSTTRSITVANTGESDLVWSLQDAAGLGAEGDGLDHGWIGKDNFGYTWMTSDSPAGPAFDWTEIRNTGTPVPLTGDDAGSGPLPMSFAVPFYGKNYSSIHVSTNGWLSFTGSGAAYRDPGRLPHDSPSTPANLIAPLWDDLDLGTARRISYLDDGSRFIVQYTDVSILGSPSSLTFQAILYPSGRIRFQYLTLQGDLRASTVGIQNAARDDGILISGHESLGIREGFAVEMAPPLPSWITVNPFDGTVAPGESVDLTMDLSTASIPDGDHAATLSILSNDPINPRIDVDVLLHAGEVDLDYILFDPGTLNLASSGKTVRIAFQLPPEYDPGKILVESVMLNGQVPANPSPVSFADENQDGVDEMILKFDREAVEALLPEGDMVPVTITGEVERTTWFTGTDIIRAIRPVLQQPLGGEFLLAGQPVEISWRAPSVAVPGITYDVLLSRDGGSSWEVLASGLEASSLTWIPERPLTAAGLIRIHATDTRGLLGYDTTDTAFVISDRLRIPRRVDSVRATSDGNDLILEWDRAPAQVFRGPADYYKILASASAGGPYLLVGTTTTESFRRPLGADPESLLQFQVVPVNAAGENPN